MAAFLLSRRAFHCDPGFRTSRNSLSTNDARRCEDDGTVSFASRCDTRSGSRGLHVRNIQIFRRNKIYSTSICVFLDTHTHTQDVRAHTGYPGIDIKGLRQQRVVNRNFSRLTRDIAANDARGGSLFFLRIARKLPLPSLFLFSFNICKIIYVYVNSQTRYSARRAVERRALIPFFSRRLFPFVASLPSILVIRPGEKIPSTERGDRETIARRSQRRACRRRSGGFDISPSLSWKFRSGADKPPAYVTSRVSKAADNGIVFPAIDIERALVD